MMILYQPFYFFETGIYFLAIGDCKIHGTNVRRISYSVTDFTQIVMRKPGYKTPFIQNKTFNSAPQSAKKSRNKKIYIRLLNNIIN